MRFRDRFDAGRHLAHDLQEYAGRDDVVVLALPRGGVPVGYELARALGAPLDILLVRKLGAPGQEELALGAIASGGIRVLNDDVVSSLGLAGDEITHLAAAAHEELERRERHYRDGREPVDFEGRITILVDDGLATGASMRAAALAVREGRPKRIVAAVPVAAGKTCDDIGGDVDEVVCATTPEPFGAVGNWYDDFSQTGDERSASCFGQAGAEAERRACSDRHHQ
jgi:putative phosphoribosyl transferase